MSFPLWCLTLNGEPNPSFRFFSDLISSLNRFFPTVRISLFAFDNVGDYYCCLLILLHLNDCDWASLLCLFREKRSVGNIKIFYCIVFWIRLAVWYINVSSACDVRAQVKYRYIVIISRYAWICMEADESVRI